MILKSREKRLKSLIKDSSEKLNVFKKTINSLTKINTEIEKEQKELTLEIELLNSQLGEISTVKTDNMKVIKKIEDFFLKPKQKSLN